MNAPMFDTNWASHSIRYTRCRSGAHADTRGRWPVAAVVGAGSLVNPAGGPEAGHGASRLSGSWAARPPTMVNAGVSSARSSGSAASGSTG